MSKPRVRVGEGYKFRGLKDLDAGSPISQAIIAINIPHIPSGGLHKNHKDKPYSSLCELLEEWIPEQ